VAKKPPVKTPADLLRQVDANLQERLDEAAIQSFAWFVRRLFPILHEGQDIVWGPHLDAICNAVQKQIEGDPAYANLMILIPPGFMKSMLVSVMRPAWLWLHHSHRQSLYTSNSRDLATRDSRRTRDVIESDTYRRLLARVGHPKRTGTCPVCKRPFPHKPWSLADDQNEKDNFATTAHGFREIIVMNGKKTGRRGDDLVVDDALDADEVKKAGPESLRSLLNDAAGTVKYIFGSRFNNPKTVTRTLVAQRIHPDDPPGVLMREGSWPWKVLSLPQEYEPEYHSDGDWRTERGQLICPPFWSVSDVAMAKLALGLTAYMAQHQQRPTNEDAAIIKRAWLSQRYSESPAELATALDEVAISVDCTFKGGESNDRVAIQVWGRRGRSAYYLLDQLCAHMGFLATVDAIRQVKERWPMARLTLVEDKANGPAVMEVLRREFSGVVGFNPNGSSKPERVKVGVVPALESGSVWLPEGAMWVDDYVEELVSFDGKAGGKDDRVDATSQMLLRWTAGVSAETVDVRVGRSAPVLATGPVTRWQTADPSVDYVVGVGADWGVSQRTASIAVVLNPQGEQMARVVGETGGEEQFARQVIEEAAYWRGPSGVAEIVVGGEKPGIAHRVALSIVRQGGRVRGRPGMYVNDGERFVWGPLDLVNLWGQFSALVRAEKIVVRDDLLGATIGDVRVEGRRLGGASPAVVALLCAAVRVEVEREVAPVRPRIEFKRASGGTDAWVKAAGMRRGVGAA